MIVVSPQYRTLSIILYVLSAIEGIAGLVLIIASGWVLSMLPVAGLTTPGLLLFALKGIGVIALALGYLLCVAARDPARYVAVVDTFAFVLFAAALLQFYAVGALGIGTVYPTPYLISRSVVQLILAIVLVALRPRHVPTAGTVAPA
ncbi:MAG: hypothetical protein JO043_00265 [Candidatus Eremiobacteraeota bacterium]|nr:hypothetical protein [Candidatus Eremiobacteraeota bacterium]